MTTHRFFVSPHTRDTRDFQVELIVRDQHDNPVLIVEMKKKFVLNSTSSLSTVVFRVCMQSASWALECECIVQTLYHFWWIPHPLNHLPSFMSFPPHSCRVNGRSMFYRRKGLKGCKLLFEISGRWLVRFNDWAVLS
jgi:hypothetical protein